MDAQIALLHHLPEIRDHLPRRFAILCNHILQPVHRAGIPILRLQPDRETGGLDKFADFQTHPLLPVLPVMVSVRHAQATPVADGLKEDTSVHLSIA